MLSTIYFFVYQANCFCRNMAGGLHAAIHSWLIVVSYRLQRGELVIQGHPAAMLVWRWRRRENLAKLSKQAVVLLIWLLMALPSFTKAEAPGLLLGPCLLTVALCLSCAKLFLRGL